MKPFEIKVKPIFCWRKKNIWNMLTTRWFSRKVEIGSRWVWIHFRMSDRVSYKTPFEPSSQRRSRVGSSGTTGFSLSGNSRRLWCTWRWRSNNDRSINEARVCGQYRSPPASRGRYRLSLRACWELVDFLLTRTSSVVVFKLWLTFHIFLLCVFLPFLPLLYLSDSPWVAIYSSIHSGATYCLLPLGQAKDYFQTF